MFAFFWRLFYIFKKLCRVVKTLPPLIKLFSFNRKGFFTKPRENQKNKKTKLFGEVLVSGQKMFFLFSLSFFVFFGLDS